MAPVFSREAWRCVWHMIQVVLSVGICIHCDPFKNAFTVVMSALINTSTIIVTALLPLDVFL